MPLPAYQRDNVFEDFAGSAIVIVGSCDALEPTEGVSVDADGGGSNIPASTTQINYDGLVGTLSVDKTNKVWEFFENPETGEIILAYEDGTTYLNTVRGVMIDESKICVGCNNTLTFAQEIADNQTLTSIAKMYQVNTPVANKWYMFETFGDVTITRAGDVFNTRGNISGIINSYTQGQDITFTIPYLDAVRSQLQRFIDTTGKVFNENINASGKWMAQYVSIEGAKIATRPMFIIPVRSLQNCDIRNADGEPILYESYFIPAAAVAPGEELTFGTGTQRVANRTVTATKSKIFKTPMIADWIAYTADDHYPSDN